MRKVFLFLLVLVVMVAAIGFIFRGEITRLFLKPTASNVPEGIRTPEETDDIATIAENLDTPWGLAVLPGGDVLVTERPGKLKRVGQNGEVITVQGVEETSEGGLLGIALDPDFSNNSYLYLYFTTRKDERLINQIARFTYASERLEDKRVILDDIPASSTHDGGRLAFGPDGMLYATTGDAGVPDSAQNTQSLAGKILRMHADGAVPEDNPFGNYVYSYGHRNPQGLAWDENGQLWSSEHGPSGAASGNDEINKIEKGANYGWPEIVGMQTKEGMVAPVLESGDDDTWAPASLAYSNGSLFFAGLRSQTLYEAEISGSDIMHLRAHFREQYGRLRTVLIDNNALLLTTSNNDGRGSPTDDDDKILKIKRGLF